MLKAGKSYQVSKHAYPVSKAAAQSLYNDISPVPNDYLCFSLAFSTSSSSLIALPRMVFDKENGSDSQQMEFNLPDTTYLWLLDFYVPKRV
jgi:hypothetical protein